MHPAQNVFGVISQIYTAGRVVSDHRVRLQGLSSKCLQTLYAGSFIVYLLNLVGDWVHTYYACRGLTVTFPLRNWTVVVMVVCCVLGSVFNFLLVHLCIENAFQRPAPVEPLTGGCQLLCFRLKNCVFDFDCFRISFLIMMFEDAPMTFLNFWLISSCMVAYPNQTIWPLLCASASTVLSLLWKLVMLVLAFRYLRLHRKSTYDPVLTFSANRSHSTYGAGKSMLSYLLLLLFFALAVELYMQATSRGRELANYRS
ncbi:unnamed protein product [Soboliphyme baturini]|uniref:XK-related protein n=1 Tax=Soboliphyme baturini TaxID=241478 RepID=A0A183IJ92_9BILA|nr:unnamed protein product [Soboliphyme baturini]